MYGAHSNVPYLHASYERAFVKIYRDSPFDRLRDRGETGSGTAEGLWDRGAMLRQAQQPQAQGPWGFFENTPHEEVFRDCPIFGAILSLGSRSEPRNEIRNAV